MIELYILEQLDAFARYGTLSEAAEQLHVSQPALTRSMKKLEEETGLELFRREGRRISLNEGGKIAARYARRILDDEEDMREALEHWNKSQHTVTIGSCGEMPLDHLMPSLLQQFPDKSVTTEICDQDEKLLEKLKSGDMEIIILHELPDDTGIYAQQYIHENLYMFVPTGHSLAERKSVRLAELKDYTALVYRHIGFWLPLTKQYMPASSLLVQDSMDAMDELAESSTVLMFNTDARLKDGFESDKRKAVPIEDACMHVTYYVCCRSAQKEHYSFLFNTVRAQALQDKKLK